MIALLTFLFILGVFVIVHEFGHFIAAKRQGVRVEVFSLGFGPTVLKKKRNDTEYRINAIPLGGYVKLAGDNLEEYKGEPDEYLSKTQFQRAKIIFSGPLLNYILGFLCFWLVFFAGYPSLTTKVGGLIDGFGAKDAGVEAGDKIIAVDGIKVDYWEELQNIVKIKKADTVVKLSVLRDNKEYVLGVKIKEKQLDTLSGQKRNVGLIGITPSDDIVKVKHGFLKSFSLSLNKTKELTVLTYQATWNMLTGKLSMRESVTGPLGIFFVTSKVASLGIIAVFHLVAVLSVSLAIFNLLPLPILDGGHIILLFIEKIRGKNISPKTERIITQIGFSLIISLALIVTYNDILRFFGDKIAQFFK
ncbi:MAG: RIP metalloprotease RseP [Candidatus Omnitrophica bacterium]|nr:RIP metalloprotease RseP [Candidatus Omnitrophota bacterium]